MSGVRVPAHALYPKSRRRRLLPRLFWHPCGRPTRPPCRLDAGSQISCSSHRSGAWSGEPERSQQEVATCPRPEGVVSPVGGQIRPEQLRAVDGAVLTAFGSSAYLIGANVRRSLTDGRVATSSPVGESGLETAITPWVIASRSDCTERDGHDPRRCLPLRRSHHIGARCDGNGRELADRTWEGGLT